MVLAIISDAGTLIIDHIPRAISIVMVLSFMVIFLPLSKQQTKYIVKY